MAATPGIEGRTQKQVVRRLVFAAPMRWTASGASCRGVVHRHNFCRQALHSSSRCVIFVAGTADPSARRLGHDCATHHSFCRHTSDSRDHNFSRPCCAQVVGGCPAERGPGVALLKLRKVDLVGFKSFCERTHITFSGVGITCIVGPNGCGKSNIVDAISWVLGEQSHKSLRAERMADCIFNGTARRTPMGLAEVSLTLLDPELAEAAARVLEGQPETAERLERKETQEGTAENLSAEGQEEPGEGPPFRRKRLADRPVPHAKPGEVVIGRRLYRSGQSEYLINGRVARLRDIQELFMGMGLGPDSYAIIEQGRIGQILSSKPMDRRAIIEEAAGVTKYKTKKRLAEAKLESSKLNLSRVNDILVEV